MTIRCANHTQLRVGWSPVPALLIRCGGRCSFDHQQWTSCRKSSSAQIPRTEKWKECRKISIYNKIKRSEEKISSALTLEDPKEDNVISGRLYSACNEIHAYLAHNGMLECDCEFQNRTCRNQIPAKLRNAGIMLFSLLKTPRNASARHAKGPIPLGNTSLVTLSVSTCIRGVFKGFIAHIRGLLTISLTGQRSLLLSPSPKPFPFKNYLHKDLCPRAFTELCRTLNILRSTTMWHSLSPSQPLKSRTGLQKISTRYFSLRFRFTPVVFFPTLFLCTVFG